MRIQIVGRDAPLPQAAQDGDSLQDAGRLHHDLLEATIQGCVLATERKLVKRHGDVFDLNNERSQAIIRSQATALQTLRE